jgi:hypothetical protein
MRLPGGNVSDDKLAILLDKPIVERRFGGRQLRSIVVVREKDEVDSALKRKRLPDTERWNFDRNSQVFQ